ncbi:MAG TPA: hypothetical protein PK423_06195 [Clostridiales bacterium]|jgi:hypothetical protein|nr:hypothetical protein [Clostridiales bacterium]
MVTLLSRRETALAEESVTIPFPLSVTTAFPVNPIGLCYNIKAVKNNSAVG